MCVPRLRRLLSRIDGIIAAVPITDAGEREDTSIDDSDLQLVMTDDENIG